MASYPFNLVRPEQTEPLQDISILHERPFTKQAHSFESDAHLFVPSMQMTTAINTAIAVGEPLLITGEPGTGKTQAAYYVAWKLGIEPLLHFQVKSDSTARDLLYHFDTVRYFHDANLNPSGDEPRKPLDKRDYVEKRELWKAFTQAEEANAPRVLLIDEIDKAPRDFPNDLLHELDQMELSVAETDDPPIRPPRHLAPIVFITSNSERRLPEAFLRRCVYHHIRFDDQLAEKAIQSRRQEYANLSDEFLNMALERFLSLRNRSLRKRPTTGELLVWLRVLSLATGTYPEQLEQDLARLPYLEVLIKDRQDLQELGANEVN